MKTTWLVPGVLWTVASDSKEEMEKLRDIFESLLKDDDEKEQVQGRPESRTEEKTPS